jgi:hypothetical protein
MIPHPTTPSVDTKILDADVERLRRRVLALEERFHGFVYYNTPTLVDIVTAGVYVDLPYTGTLAIGAGVEPATGKLGLKNISKKPYLIDVVATFDAEAVGSNKVIGLRLVKNGTAIDGCLCEASVANNTIGKLHSFGQVWVEPGEEVTMQAANMTNANDFEFERGRMRWTRVPGIG